MLDPISNTDKTELLGFSVAGLDKPRELTFIRRQQER